MLELSGSNCHSPPYPQEPGIPKIRFSPRNCWTPRLSSCSAISAGPCRGFVLRLVIFGIVWFWVETRLCSVVQLWFLLWFVWKSGIFLLVEKEQGGVTKTPARPVSCGVLLVAAQLCILWDQGLRMWDGKGCREMVLTDCGGGGADNP